MLEIFSYLQLSLIDDSNIRKLKTILVFYLCEKIIYCFHAFYLFFLIVCALFVFGLIWISFIIARKIERISLELKKRKVLHHQFEISANGICSSKCKYKLSIKILKKIFKQKNCCVFTFLLDLKKCVGIHLI